MNNISYDVVNLKTMENAQELIATYCNKNGYSIKGDELEKWINKIISVGDPLGILYGNEIIAFLLLYCNKYDTLEAFICNVFVREDFRGKRLSELLVKKAIEICKDRNFKCVNLDVVRNNESAVRVYTSCGFCKTGSFIKESESYYKMTLLL